MHNGITYNIYMCNFLHLQFIISVLYRQFSTKVSNRSRIIILKNKINDS